MALFVNILDKNVDFQESHFLWKCFYCSDFHVFGAAIMPSFAKRDGAITGSFTNYQKSKHTSSAHFYDSMLYGTFNGSWSSNLRAEIIVAFHQFLGGQPFFVRKQTDHVVQATLYDKKLLQSVHFITNASFIADAKLEETKSCRTQHGHQLLCALKSFVQNADTCYMF